MSSVRTCWAVTMTKFYRYQPGTLNMQEEPIPAAYQGASHIYITPMSFMC